MSKSKRLYFGHPVNTYNTDLEAFLLQIIEERFPRYEIENPNQEHHAEGYQRWKQETGNGMNYFKKKVLPRCQGGVFLPFYDGAWPAGVFKEMQFFYLREFPVFKITPDGFITTLVDIPSTDVLSVEETRSRIRDASGNTIPY